MDDSLATLLIPNLELLLDIKMRQQLFTAVSTLLLFLVVTLPFFAASTPVQPLEATSNETDRNTEPSITIQSPINQTYTTGNIALNFTVTKPAAWYKPATGYSNPLLITTYGRLVSLIYTLDGLQSQNISISEPDVWTINFGTADTPANRTFSFNLTEVSTGQHSLQIVVYALVYVSGGTTKSLDEPFSSVITAPVVANSSTINFTVDDDAPSNSAAPLLGSSQFWVTLLLIAVTVIAAAIIIRYKKMKVHGLKV